MKRFYLFVGFGVTLLSANAQNVADFENIHLDSVAWWNGSDGSGGFESGGFNFPNDYNTEWGSWSGFAVSNMEDSTTAGYGNQYSAITAAGAEESKNYAVAYLSGEQEIIFDNLVNLNGFYITNATYTYLSIKNGDDFTKKFGGVDGTESDYFKLIIYGKDGGGNILDSVEFFLADFRFEDSGDDYIVNDWQWVDLISLGAVNGIEFKLESTDTGMFGMNTPSYFCMDNFSGNVTVSAKIFASTDLKVYPNPVKDNFYVESTSEINEVVLTDNSGKIVFQQKVFGERMIKISSLTALPKGIYYLRLRTDKEILDRKILKL